MSFDDIINAQQEETRPRKPMTAKEREESNNRLIQQQIDDTKPISTAEQERLKNRTPQQVEDDLKNQYEDSPTPKGKSQDSNLRSSGSGQPFIVAQNLDSLNDVATRQPELTEAQRRAGSRQITQSEMDAAKFRPTRTLTEAELDSLNESSPAAKPNSSNKDFADILKSSNFQPNNRYDSVDTNYVAAKGTPTKEPTLDNGAALF
jgi:hypothetical protein